LKDTEHDEQRKHAADRSERDAKGSERDAKGSEPEDAREGERGSAIRPESLPPPEKLAIDADDVVAVADHFHQHDDEPDLNYDAPPPG
jgi:hypothetical protein